mmetsp:Transcript_45640/g.74408  ORF Transcript_45640/g.74408 Transcript_45640/m.74408 type:complete len:540 (-) Transcript_45640:724-2343(-)|eukprot:CAMPEP_0184658684 /NCGR_PEP_ID=MMETSP0308-20130426/26508_1 /TAXON_ID=38269 /ORGANISM="Gloeochaete witrockiana, Strain SAG 46.84" /LENGTH=539 /DNA_ID=CAMNT_0027097861 /DNA_START=55 /DNA_END=1674 /DNA_ORIENTATION=-
MSTAILPSTGGSFNAPMTNVHKVYYQQARELLELFGNNQPYDFRPLARSLPASGTETPIDKDIEEAQTIDKTEQRRVRLLAESLLKPHLVGNQWELSSNSEDSSEEDERRPSKESQRTRTKKQVVAKPSRPSKPKVIKPNRAKTISDEFAGNHSFTPQHKQDESQEPRVSQEGRHAQERGLRSEEELARRQRSPSKATPRKAALQKSPKSSAFHPHEVAIQFRHGASEDDSDDQGSWFEKRHTSMREALKQVLLQSERPLPPARGGSRPPPVVVLGPMERSSLASAGSEATGIPLAPLSSLRSTILHDIAPINESSSVDENPGLNSRPSTVPTVASRRSHSRGCHVATTSPSSSSPLAKHAFPITNPMMIIPTPSPLDDLKKQQLIEPLSPHDPTSVVEASSVVQQEAIAVNGAKSTLEQHPLGSTSPTRAVPIPTAHMSMRAKVISDIVREALSPPHEHVSIEQSASPKKKGSTTNRTSLNTLLVSEQWDQFHQQHGSPSKRGQGVVPSAPSDSGYRKMSEDESVGYTEWMNMALRKK